MADSRIIPISSFFLNDMQCLSYFSLPPFKASLLSGEHRGTFILLLFGRLELAQNIHVLTLL
jgi:hypothetical protein